MSFADPFQRAHKISGMKAAASSPKTPAHLVPHLQRSAEAGMKGMVIPRGVRVAPYGRRTVKPSIPGLQTPQPMGAPLNDNDGDEAASVSTSAIPQGAAPIKAAMPSGNQPKFGSFVKKSRAPKIARKAPNPLYGD